MTPPLDDPWQNATQAEIATAESPVSADSVCNVAAAYEAADLPGVALAVLRKASCFGVETKPLLPGLLRGLRRQRQFAELNTVTQTGLALAQRDPALHRELALALACLNQIPAAEQEWAALIRAGHMAENDWLHCARFVMNCPDAPSLFHMMTAITEREDLRTHVLAGYCAVRHLMDQDPAAAQRALLDVDPVRAGAGDPDVLLDLSLLAWRLGDFSKAEAAARLAIASQHSPPSAPHLLASIRSFAGDFSLLRCAPLPAAQRVENRISDLAAALERDNAAWGFIHRRSPEVMESTMLDLTAEPDMVVPENGDVVATFSILPEDLGRDPYLILGGVDWSWPHVLLQRMTHGDAPHWFVGAQGSKNWMWEEIRPERREAGNDGAKASERGADSIWIQALRELQDEDEP